MIDSPLTDDEMKREALFVPCQSREHLRRWIRIYLGIDLPDCTICDDDVSTPPSNSNPLDLIWEVYHKALEGTDPNFQRILLYAARDSYKTVSCAILEILCLFHLRRSVAHMAAIEQQAQKCAQYVERHFQRPILCDFLTSKNKRTLEITYYRSDSGRVLSISEFEALKVNDPNKASKYKHSSYYIKILVATIQSANSEHCPFVIFDELDIAPPGPIKEAMMIPSPGERGELPITFMTSTRKFSFGMVQKEIDSAKETGLVIRHWNIIDVSNPCPPKRHLPDQPKIPIFYSEKFLRAIRKDDYDLLSDDERQYYKETTGYVGCLSNCSLFSVCRGRLATKQTSSSPLLKDLNHVTSLFKTFAKDVDIAKAQMMCWKPSSAGLIYPNFQRSIHMLSPSRMAHEITGDVYEPNMSKAQLIKLMLSNNMPIHAGMDFGFTHNFAVVTAAQFGNRLFVFHVLSVAGLELNQKIELCNNQIKYLNPTIYPDPAYPSDIKTFRRSGYTCKSFTKDVLLGINTVRGKLMPSLGAPPEIFFLEGDDGCELLAQRLSRYHWCIDAAGNPTDEPDDTEDDELDALRYLCQVVFGRQTKLRMGNSNVQHQPTTVNQQTDRQWMSDKIKELAVDSQQTTTIKGRKGGFVFDI